MQEKIVGTIPKGENIIIMLEDMEEKGSKIREMWHNTIYRHNRLGGS